MWKPDSPEEPRTISIIDIIGEDSQLRQLKSDGEFLYLLTEDAFLVTEMETTQVLFSHDMSEGAIIDFYVSPGDDFYALLISKDPTRNVMLVIQAEEQGLLFPGQAQDELTGLTRKFYLDQKGSFDKYSIFEGSELRRTEESLLGQQIFFKTSEKKIREVFFDDATRGLFYVQYSDHTFEGYVICRDFDQCTRVDRIDEINLQSNQQENVLLKVETNLEILDASDGQLTLYDRRNDDATSESVPTGDLPGSQIGFSLTNNTDIVFSVPGPGFERLNQAQSDSESE